MATRFLDQYGLEHFYALTKTEKIASTQTSATNAWAGATVASKLAPGKMILYILTNGSSNNSDATLELTLRDGTTTGPLPVLNMKGNNIKAGYTAGSALLMLYDGSDWRVLHGPDRLFEKLSAISTSSVFTFDPSGYAYETGDEYLMEVYINGLRLNSNDVTIGYQGGAMKVTLNYTISGNPSTDFIHMVMRK